MFAVYVEGLGGDGYVDALASEAHKLRGYPPIPTDAELEAEDTEGRTVAGDRGKLVATLEASTSEHEPKQSARAAIQV